MSVKEYVELKNIYVFWAYDLFPYVLSGEAVGINGDGLIKTKDWGGMFVRPLLILPIESGKTLAAKIEEIKVQRQNYEKEMTIDFNKKLYKIAPFANHNREKNR